jgi:tryptophan-rich sensory protein
VWRHRIHEDLWLALALFMAQLILNGLWSFVIFGGRRPGAALVEITVLLVAVAMTAMRFAELFTPGVLADDPLLRMGPICFLLELRNPSPE